jgi:predicted acyltransferase
MESNTKFDFSQRNTAIDILRALTVLLMIFVNDFWSIKGIPLWMKHADKGVDFLGLADVVYPIFLFVVGMSIPFALENRFRKGLSGESTALHIFSRFFALLIMGAFTELTLAGMSRDVSMTMPVWKMLMVPGFFLIWNAYPRTDKPVRHLYTALQILGVLLLIYLAFTFRDRNGGYFRGSWGILGSIGWAYLFCAFVYLFVRNNVIKIFLFWLGLFVYIMIKSKLLIPKEPNIINDMMDIAHIGSTTALTMGGVLFSLLIAKYAHLEVRKKVLYFASLVVIVLTASYISHQFWIVSKIGATPPWILYCSAITIGTYGFLHWAVSKGKAGWFNIIKAGGTATLSCYVMPYFLQSIFYRYIPISLPEWMKTDIYGLMKCFVWALLCVLFTALLEKYKVKLKI